MQAGGQLPCGGRFGGGAGGAKVLTVRGRPMGGAEGEAEDDEIAELGVAAVPLLGEWCRTVHVVAAAATTTIAPAAAGISH